jgi:hypothetical protein
MKDALDEASRAFDSSPDPEIRALVPRISQYQAKMEPLAYDCINYADIGISTMQLQVIARFSAPAGCRRFMAGMGHVHFLASVPGERTFLRRRASADADQLRTGEPNASSRETGHLLQYPNANANVAPATD